MNSTRLTNAARRTTARAARTSQRPHYPDIWRQAPGTVAAKAISQFIAATRSCSR